MHCVGVRARAYSIKIYRRTGAFREGRRVRVLSNAIEPVCDGNVQPAPCLSGGLSRRGITPAGQRLQPSLLGREASLWQTQRRQMGDCQGLDWRGTQSNTTTLIVTVILAVRRSLVVFCSVKL